MYSTRSPFGEKESSHPPNLLTTPKLREQPQPDCCGEQCQAWEVQWKAGVLIQQLLTTLVKNSSTANTIRLFNRLTEEFNPALLLSLTGVKRTNASGIHSMRKSQLNTQGGIVGLWRFWGGGVKIIYAE
jgi:hypothetical protein